MSFIRQVSTFKREMTFMCQVSTSKCVTNWGLGFRVWNWDLGFRV